MHQDIVQLALLVEDYDAARDFYVEKLGFVLLEDSVRGPGKRWVRVAPPGSKGPCLLLAKASNADQQACIGKQTGGRVFLFLHTDDLDRDYARLKEKGVPILNEPSTESFGKVLHFADLYGNIWDLIEPKQEN